MDKLERKALFDLVTGQRWASLATFEKDAPYASYVAYVPEPDLGSFILHLSHLAPHTKNLLANPQAALAISEPDSGVSDPQTLARVSIQGTVHVVAKDTPEYKTLQALYIQGLPESRQLFGFSDFILFRLVPEQARYVAGFGKTWTLDVRQWMAVTEHNK